MQTPPSLDRAARGGESGRSPALPLTHCPAAHSLLIPVTPTHFYPPCFISFSLSLFLSFPPLFILSLQSIPEVDGNVPMYSA